MPSIKIVTLNLNCLYITKGFKGVSYHILYIKQSESLILRSMIYGKNQPREDN
jgi:hypothetical protein